MPSTLAVSGGASTAVVGLYLVRSVLEQIGKGVVKAVHNPSYRDLLNPCPYHLSVFEQEIEPVNWLFLLISFLSGWFVGSVFTYCCCVCREPPREIRRTVIRRNGF